MNYLLYRKEWIKTRWALAALALLSIIIIVNVWITVNHDLRFVNAPRYWNAVVFEGYQFYGRWMRYIPFVAGIVIAIVQFVPEQYQKRLKITLHLPMRENRILLSMLSFGIVMLTAIFFILTALLTILSIIYFPVNIVWAALSTVLPWMLGGYAAYGILSMIITEPVWRYRIPQIILLAGVVYCFSFGYAYKIYNNILLTITIMAIALLMSLIYSGNRFKRGEM